MIDGLWRLYRNIAAVVLIIVAALSAYLVLNRHVIIMPTALMESGRDGHRDFLETFATPAPNAIMMLGDSITQNGRFHHLFPHHHVLNYGVTGDTTAQVKARLQPVIKTAPAKIFLMVGTNDVHRPIPVKDSIANVRALLTQLRTALPNTQLYLHPVTPRTPKLREKIEAINAGYQALATEMGIPYIDLYTPMLAGDGGIKPEYTTDQLHFTGAGYTVWINAIRPYIEED